MEEAPSCGDDCRWAMAVTVQCCPGWYGDFLCLDSLRTGMTSVMADASGRSRHQTDLAKTSKQHLNREDDLINCNQGLKDIRTIFRTQDKGIQWSLGTSMQFSYQPPCLKSPPTNICDNIIGTMVGVLFWVSGSNFNMKEVLPNHQVILEYQLSVP